VPLLSHLYDEIIAAFNLSQDASITKLQRDILVTRVHASSPCQPSVPNSFKTQALWPSVSEDLPTL